MPGKMLRLRGMLDQDGEKSYREALYALLERSKATRAALYFMEPTGDFRLTAHYGFSPRDMPAAQFGKGHPLLERVNHFRKPFFYNSPDEAGSLGEEMERSKTARVLVAPIYDDGRLVGIVEARDKAAGELFFPEDLRLAAALAVQLLKIRRSQLGAPEPVPDEGPMPGVYETGPPPPPPSFHDVPASAPALHPEIEFPAVTVPPRRETTRPPLTQREAVLFRGFASMLLLDPAVEAVVFSLWLETGIEFYIGARREFSDDARGAVVASAMGAWNRLASGRPAPVPQRFNLEFPHGKAPDALTRSGIAAAQTSSVVAEEGRAVLFTLVFGREPDPRHAPAIKETHLLVRRAILEAREAARYRDAYRGLIRRFLEPGLKRYSALVTHSLAAAKISRRFASHLKLADAVVEQITVGALLHDIGLRELSYERLAQKRPLTEPEYRLAKDHPAVGAMLLSEVDFPYPVVPLIHHHHERYDGSGYPDQLRGEQIPFGARLIHIVESFDAMTSASSYRSAVARDAAVDTIVSKGGTQFDPDLANQFRAFVASGGLDRP
jgi:putative nucleotidyltransferase with HDIG domain